MQSWIPVFRALWFLSGKKETEGTDVSFPTVRKLLIQGKGRKVESWKVFRRGLEAGQATDG